MAQYDPAVKELEELLESPDIKDVKPEVRQKLERILDMCNKRHDYADEITTPQSDILAYIHEQTTSHPWEQAYTSGKTKWNLESGMISGLVTCQFLKFVISMMQAKQVLEIGMFTGYTALAMAEALPADGEVVTCEISEYLKDMTADFFSRSQHGKKIKTYFAPAEDTLNNLIKDGRSFDVIFIDANKPGYKGYVDIILENGLLAPRGIILADNAYLSGTSYINPRTREDNVMNDFNQHIKNNPQLQQVLLPIRDGILAIRRKSDVEGQAAE
ncbi:hypothetical protein SNE40_000389 [Patella caerulea]|uniref:Caffeoyl-CoA O-methyltransferase n=1 Tax=Patella caerulea TaxID=87958 RepID=A0AAN8QGX3_PATCE